jgi:hypothetical protein
MKQTLNRYQFEQAFQTMGRYDNFGYQGLSVLFDYLSDYEEQTGEELELDVIALCCDYSHDTWKEIAENYSIDITDCEDEDSARELVEEFLQENTTLCGVTDIGFVYQNF